MNNMELRNHRLSQLQDRINQQGLLPGENYSDGKMCIIGHMADMAGVLWEDVRERYYDEGGVRESFAIAGGMIDRNRCVRHADTICDHFNVDLDFLYKLQSKNDGSDGDVEEVVKYIDEYVF